MNTGRPDPTSLQPRPAQVAPAKRVREPQATCLLAGLAIFGAAAGLAAVVWATYDAFDHGAFDMHAAIVEPMLSVLQGGVIRSSELHGLARGLAVSVAGALS
ncbi:hypothetical protein [Variovorax ginsengisoli]|uniref:Uncharacterized protein n=1 Tax=Variovorax ginsengisoli TaxID=363844 RepID=A0ABT9S2X7_9BURK|nr:hypothetical protein [Variovorax ginsengisoli]MDP9898709.1 hypothetical protein [Variovorax ginsengisoli]